jgi:TPR repeat protein
LSENGQGVTTDFVIAAKYYKLAADQNHTNAQYDYARCLADGSGVAIDLVNAAKYYKLAADQNHAAAQFEYAFVFTMRMVFPWIWLMPYNIISVLLIKMWPRLNVTLEFVYILGLVFPLIWLML